MATRAHFASGPARGGGVAAASAPPLADDDFDGARSLVDDAASSVFPLSLATTSDFPTDPTLHADLRQRERNIHLRLVQATAKHGIATDKQ
jgi:hypothetical protein